MTNLDKNSYILKEVLHMKEEETIVICSKCLEISKKSGSGLSAQCIEMKQFIKTRSLYLVWMSDKFNKEIPENELDSDTYKLLSQEYDRLDESYLSTLQVKYM